MSGFIERVFDDIMKREELFRSYIERVIELLEKRATLVLFGSRARGDHMTSSDYDLAVIIDYCDDILGLTEALLSIRPRGLSIDIVVLERRELGDPLVARMLTPCRIVYDGLGLSDTLCRH